LLVVLKPICAAGDDRRPECGITKLTVMAITVQRQV
jgi:hypothetical protein